METPDLLVVHPMMSANAFVEAGKNGIVCNEIFWTWGEIQEYVCIDGGLVLRLWRARDDFTDFRIAESEKLALDRILRKYTGCVD